MYYSFKDNKSADSSIMINLNNASFILVNPSYPPQIRGTKQQYLGGETVNATCISAPSRPEAMLKWWINEKEVRKMYLFFI